MLSLQLEAAGEPGKEEGGPSLQSSKAFLNRAAFERNGRSGEAGRARGFIRGKATLGFTGLSGVVEYNDGTQACIHVLVYLPHPRPTHTC